MPSPMAVLPNPSRARIPALYPALSFNRPPASISVTSLSMACSLFSALSFKPMLSCFSNSVIRMKIAPPYKIICPSVSIFVSHSVASSRMISSLVPIPSENAVAPPQAVPSFSA